MEQTKETNKARNKYANKAIIFFFQTYIKNRIISALITTTTQILSKFL